jgi:signal peptidase I
MPITNEEHVVPAKELAVGDIISFRHGAWTERRIVVKMTETSAVTRSHIGQNGRVQFTRKVKGKPADVVVYKIGHYALTPEILEAFEEYYPMGDYNRALWRHGMYKDLPRFGEIFGFAPGEDPSSISEAEEIVKTVSSTGEPEGDKVQITRRKRKDYGQPGYPDKEEFGALVISGEHGFPIGWVRGDLDTVEQAEECADMYLGKRYFDGWDTEEALNQARYLSEVTKPRPGR